MANTRYKRGLSYAADMAVYTREMAADNAQELDKLKENLAKALRQDVTDRQRQFLLLYYGQGLNMRQIGERMGVNKSTVSRVPVPHHQARGGPAPAVSALWRGPAAGGRGRS